MSKSSAATPWLKIVVIGGGTGNATVLTGLKHIAGNGLTAIVNTFDDGGGAGRLREEYKNMLAVGDFRQCIEALSHAPEQQRKVFNWRFEDGDGQLGSGLGGQTLGNLIIAAASQQNGGNFSDALSLVGRLYDITGTVLPASHDNRRLLITTIDGQVINGEHAAELTEIKSLKGAKLGFDREPTSLSSEAETAIRAADIVVLAPGDLYTSIAPTIAVNGMCEALTDKPVILVTNLMNRGRHTVSFSALDYAQEYERILGIPAGQHVIDRVIYNTELPSKTALAMQAKLGSHPVEPDLAGLKKAGFVAVGKDLLSHAKVVLDPKDRLHESRSQIRHDPDKIANAIMGVYFLEGFANKAI